MSEHTRQRSGLTAITIENFKGIGAPVTVPLKPITLLFGANSAGKSTVIQALQYAWEVLENRNPDVDRTRLGGEVIDLGGFRNLVHRHDLSRQIKIGLEYCGVIYNEPYVPSTETFSRIQGTIFGNCEECDVCQWFDTSRSAVQVTVGWNDATQEAEILTYQVTYHDVVFGSFERDDDHKPRFVVNTNHPFFVSESITAGSYVEKLITQIEEFFGGFGSFKRELNLLEPEERDKEKQRILELVDKAIKTIPAQSETDESKSTMSAPRVHEVIPEWGQSLNTSSDDRLWLPDESDWALTQLMLGPGESVRHAINGLRYLGPLRQIPNRAFLAPLRPQQSRWAKGLGAWDALMQSDSSSAPEQSLIERCSHYLHDVLGLGYTIRKEDRIQLPSDSRILTDLRMIAARYEEREGSELRERVLEPLEILPRISFVQLRDERNGIDVNPMDIGVGVSQTLPVVVGAVEPNCSIFAVEQPELHIHPRVQVNLADVFLIELLGYDKRQRTALIETHSEHLVLRIMRRMRETHEGTLPPGIPPVRPEDVAVLYVEIVDGTTYIREMPLNARGELVKAWPGGFFEEALEETL